MRNSVVEGQNELSGLSFLQGLNIKREPWRYFWDLAFSMGAYYAIAITIAIGFGPFVTQSQTDAGALAPAESWMSLILGGGTEAWFGLWLGLGMVFIASMLLYRTMLFSHEIAHFAKDEMRGFFWFWHAVAGVVFLMPSFFLRSHAHHHATPYYGTVRDPEYLPFAHMPQLRWRFVAFSWVTPLFLLYRALVLVPLSWISPVWLIKLRERYSVMRMHQGFTGADFVMRNCDWWLELLTTLWVYAVLMGGVYVFLYANDVQQLVYWSALAFWLLTSALAATWNNYRVLYAHRYTSDYQGMDKTMQVLDSRTLICSKTMERAGGYEKLCLAALNAFWYLFAPVGQRFHALHHLFPHLPYHVLSKVHRELLSKPNPYAQVYAHTLMRQAKS